LKVFVGLVDKALDQAFGQNRFNYLQRRNFSRLDVAIHKLMENALLSSCSYENQCANLVSQYAPIGILYQRQFSVAIPNRPT
jgi:hypothetical protein